MTAGGWIVLVTSVVLVTSLAVFCFWRLLTLPPPDADSEPSPEED